MGLKVDTSKSITKVNTDTKPVTPTGTNNPVSIFSIDNLKEHKEELAIASGIATAGLIVLSLLTRKRLPKHIEFESARNVEEAIKFTKRLGIKKVEEIELAQESKNREVLNKINKELVRLINLSEGDVKMPKTLKFVRRFDKKDTLGTYNPSRKCLSVAVKNVHGNAGLNKQIDDFLKTVEENQKSYSFGKSTNYQVCGVTLDIEKCLPDEILELYKIYQKRPYLLNRNELDKLGSYLKFFNEQLQLLKEHSYTLHLLSGMKYKELASMSVDELNVYIKLNTQKSSSMERLYKFFRDRKINELDTFDHEFAHAQFNESPFLGTISKKEAWKRKKNLLQQELKDAPDFVKEFFSKEGQFIAGKVTAYARTSVDEFLAEVYAMLVQGNKLDKEIIDMYLKCGGKIPKGLKNYII